MHDDTYSERIKKTEQAFLEACIKHDYQVTADNRISEANAALLIGYDAASLKNMRAAGTGPSSYKRSVGSCFNSYRLDDLAIWIETKRNNCELIIEQH